MAIPSKSSITSATIFGTETTDDYLVGTSADDIISGGVETVVYTADGIDTMIGGLGDDQYIVNDTTGNDTIIEFDNEGVDTVFASVSYTLPAFVENIVASAGTVILTGNLLNNILDGSQGTANIADTLKGMEGNDTYIMGTNDKVIEGKPAIATATVTTQYTDTGGIDTISSAVTVDISPLIGAATQLVLASSPDAIRGAAFIENVVLTGSAAGTNITGNAKDNHLTGNSVANTLIGGAGNDILDGAAAADTLTGGLGNDTYIVDNAGDDVTEVSLGALVADGVNGISDLVKSSVTYSLATAPAAGVENLTLTGIAAINATGNDKVNVLIGNSAVNTLTGGAANDTLTGLQGADILDGGIGADKMVGGRQSDTYIVDNIGDSVTELSTDSTGTADFVKSSVTYSLNTAAAAGVEKLNLTGTAVTNATGNALDNIINGNAKDNVIDGLAGADTMAGLAGNDTYIVNNAGDTVTDTAGIDTVKSSVSFNLLTGGASSADTKVENLTLTATGSSNTDSATGNGLNNTLIGNAGNNAIDGKTGADNMQGGLGNDTYTVDDIADKVTDTGGADIINTSVTFNLSAGSNVNGNTNVETINLTGSVAIDIIGNSLNNVINGSANTNAGTSTIDAGAGNDTITGGVGQDIITTGAGTDTVVFAAVTDSTFTATSIAGVDLYNDLVLSAASGDKINLSTVISVDTIGTSVTANVAESTFIADMNTALSAASFTNADVHAAIVTVGTGGGFVADGAQFLAVDVDNSGTFTTADFVIEITGSTVTSLTTATFI
jgi:Ca2+-binding RTX toxin-like protein